MTVLHLIPRDTRTELWITGGIERRWRVTSDVVDYGEFDEITDARLLLALLLLGNPDRFRGIGE